ncbi:MAG: recombinase family protein [Candidatus Obscuribacter sp.]|nr:recombinase family protein [Candidatus Obscuribacter sp.]MBP6348768.1 recombinase family protein [Candidatus Obscuribacter sp.]MBP6591636.1 recombinase family protein [Candidatus Obscuribacter sp.]MBP7575820.1 recombinase family protein [Candidatus Obscuribacter sp.]
MKAIGYPRVSSVTQGNQGFSLKDQVQAIEGFAEREGLELVAHYPEVESASSMIGRPIFTSLLAQVYQSDVEAIIITNLDRSTRSLLDYELLKRQLKQNGKRLISVQESYLTPIHDRPDDDYLETAIQHRMVEAEAERKRISRRCNTGKARKVSQGGWNGHVPPYEYDVMSGELVLNRDRWRVCRLIVWLSRLKKKNGKPLMGTQKIANYLNGKNNLIDPKTGLRGRVFPTAMQKPQIKKRHAPYQRPFTYKWSQCTVYLILKQMRSGERLKWQKRTA